MFQRPGPGPYVEVHHGGGHPWFGFVLLLVLIGALALAAITLWRTYRLPVPPAAAPAAAASGPPPRDPALAELRLRYARGEIDRDDYLQRSADLGDVVAVPPPAPTNTDT